MSLGHLFRVAAYGRLQMIAQGSRHLSQKPRSVEQSKDVARGRQIRSARPGGDVGRVVARHVADQKHAHQRRGQRHREPPGAPPGEPFSTTFIA